MKEKFLDLLDKQRTSFGKILFEPIPINQTDISAFNYRMENCVNMITKNQIKLYRMCELKKLMLKNKKMRVYFEEHPKEKAVIMKD